MHIDWIDKQNAITFFQMVHHGISIHLQNTSCVTDAILIHGYLTHLSFDVRHITSICVII